MDVIIRYVSYKEIDYKENIVLVPKVEYGRVKYPFQMYFEKIKNNNIYFYPARKHFSMPMNYPEHMSKHISKILENVKGNVFILSPILWEYTTGSGELCELDFVAEFLQMKKREVNLYYVPHKYFFFGGER